MKLQPSANLVERGLNVGGESGGGGLWLRGELYKALQKLMVRLKKENPHHLNLVEFESLLAKTEYVFISDEKQFRLNNKDYDAINFFPQKLKLQLLTPAWKNYFAHNFDVTTQLYHEFLPFFFGNDYDYIRARDLGNSPVDSNFSVLEGGLFAPDFTETPECVIQLEFNKVRKQVTARYNDNPLNKVACSHSQQAPLVFQCTSNQVIQCLAPRSSNGSVLAITMSDTNHFAYTWPFKKTQPGISLKGTTFHRVVIEGQESPVSMDQARVFREFGGVSNRPDLSYSDLCNFAFQEGELKALSRCRSSIRDSKKEFCEATDSNVVKDSAYTEGRSCLIAVTVERRDRNSSESH